MLVLNKIIIRILPQILNYQKMNFREKIKNKWSFTRNPYVSTVSTFLLLFTGVMGSLYSREIRSLFPFQWKFTSFTQGTIIFWVSALIAALLFFVRQRSADRDRHESITRLHDAIRTVPPPDFMTVCRHLYGIIRQATSEVSYTEEIKEVIRTSLRALTTLVAQFDRSGEKAEYGTNIMLFKAIQDQNEDELQEIYGRLKFIEKECSVRELKGILELQTELSANSKTEEAVPDPALEPFALPIPREPITVMETREKKERWRILPGAPMAFETNKPSFFHNANHLLEWCDASGDFTEYVKEQLRQYFLIQMKNSIFAFVSLPLPVDNIGVINIHSNRPGLFLSDQHLAHFSNAVFPFLFDICELVKRLSNSQSQNGNTEPPRKKKFFKKKTKQLL